MPFVPPTKRSDTRHLGCCAGVSRGGRFLTNTGDALVRRAIQHGTALVAIADGSICWPGVEGQPFEKILGIHERSVDPPDT